MDKLTAGQRKKDMQSLKAFGSKVETAHAKTLFKQDLQCRKSAILVFIKPDLTFMEYELALFVGIEFWRGKDLEIRKFVYKSNQKIWLKQTERDKEVSVKQTAKG